MNILLTNDDGLETTGLKTLYQALKKVGEVTVISPFSQQSAVSHSITIFNPLFIETVCDYLPDGKCSYAIRGTPADCVKLALSHILKKKPDIVVAGINAGANVGIDVFYSGTVAAAIEGGLWGITSFAVSVETLKGPRESIPKQLQSAKSAGNNPNFQPASVSAVKVIKSILRLKPPKGSIFNINVPNLAIKQIKGVKYTQQDIEFSRDEFSCGIDPRGRRYYWMKPGPHTKNKKIKRPVRPARHMAGGGWPLDTTTLKSGYISVTPLKANLTDFNGIR